MRDSIDLLRYVQEAAERFVAAIEPCRQYLHDQPGTIAPDGLLEELDASVVALERAVEEARGA
jgi:hypothetical protein